MSKDPPHRIRLLEDTQGNDRFDKSTVFADCLTYPQGVLWEGGAVYCASPPSLWRFQDTRHNGVADRREELITGFTFTRWADDLHGPVAGPDGRVYWTSGRYPYQVRRPGGKILHQGNGPLVLRCRPDGRDVEIYCSAIGNAVEVAFTPQGEPFAIGTYALAGSDGQAFAGGKYVFTGNERDALIHCVPGGVYPIKDRKADELAGVKHPGDLLPVLLRLDAVAPSGLLRYRGHALGTQYRDNLFAALFGARAVQRYILQRDGATFTARAEDFLVGISENFHPTDVLEDADGSLLVVDTGNWYSLCPGSHVGKTLVKGGIYRVRRQGAVRPADPHGQSLAWQKLPPREQAALLDDGRFAVRDQAVARLARDGAVPVLREVLQANRSSRARRNAVWALARIDGARARAAVRRALDDKDPSVRQTAVYVAGLHRDADALPRLLELLRTDSPPIRREAATALGRLGKPAAVPALLKALETAGDRFLEHALVYALIEIHDRPGTLAGLTAASPQVRRGAVLALDQMDGGNLAREQVAPLLDTTDAALQQTVLRIIARHPGWADALTGLVRDWLHQQRPTAERQEMLRSLLLAVSREAPVQAVVAQALGDEKTPTATRLLLLETIARAPLDRLPAAWVQELGRALGDRDERVVLQALAALRAGGVSQFDPALLRLARDPARSEAVHLAALQSVVARVPALDAALLDFLMACLGEEKPPLLRLGAATCLGQAPLSKEQLGRLTPALARAGPLELSRLLPAYERSHDADLGKQLVAALGRSPGLSSLSADAVRRTLAPYPPAVREQASPLLKRLEVDSSNQAARLADLVPLLGRGDPARGRQVFFGKKAACSTCHAVRGEGGHVGPDLSRIGATRTGRELLEAVVFPSASFARGYEPYTVATTDGRILNGIVTRETADALYLVNAERAEIRLPRSSIDTILPSKVSIMPQGLDAQLTPGEFAAMLAFLQSLK